MSGVATIEARELAGGSQRRRLAVPGSPLPAAAWGYWGVVVGPAAAAVGVALTHLHGVDWARFALLASAASIAQLLSVRLSRRRTFHPAIVFVLAGALMLPPAAIVLMCVLQHVPEWVRQRYAWYVQPFNMANYLAAALAAWATAHALASAVPGADGGLAVAGVGAAAAFVVVNRLLLGPMLRLSRGLRAREAHLVAFDDVALEFVLALMAVPFVALLPIADELSALSLAPLVLIHVTQRATSRLQSATDTIVRQNESLEAAHALVIERSTAALEALSATVDARDKYTAGHSKRVRAIAVVLAEQLGVAGADLETVSQAALLHDIGKIGVPDSVLLKEGKLSQGEWLIMRSHPGEGARIIERLGYLDEVVPAIRHHHERPDGRGYPDGLIGDETPLAARIIHVADAIDAMTTERVYRAALSFDEAIAEVRRGRGTDFCRECVDGLDRALANGSLECLVQPQEAAA